MNLAYYELLRCRQLMQVEIMSIGEKSYFRALNNDSLI